VVGSGFLGDRRVELAAQGETTQHREHLDVEAVWGVHIAGQGVEKVGIGVAPDQSLDHRRGVDHDHRRPAWTAATMSADDGPVLRSRALSCSTICALVGRAAILASSAATYADSDLPSAAARSLSVAATSSGTSRMYIVVIGSC